MWNFLETDKWRIKAPEKLDRIKHYVCRNIKISWINCIDAVPIERPQLYSSCITDQDCKYLQGSSCAVDRMNPDPSLRNRKVCLCEPGSQVDKDATQCQKQRSSSDQECVESSQCVVGADCVDFKCRCRDGLHFNDLGFCMMNKSIFIF